MALHSKQPDNTSSLEPLPSVPQKLLHKANMEVAERKEFVTTNGRVQQYPEFQPRNPIIMRGGFPIVKVSPKDDYPRMRVFPPPPIAAYGLSLDCRQNRNADLSTNYHLARMIHEENSGNSLNSLKHYRHREGSTSSSDQSSRDNKNGAVLSTTNCTIPPDQSSHICKDGSIQPTSGSIPKIGFGEGVIIADRINSHRKSLVEHTPGASGVILSAKEQLGDFIVNLPV